MSPRGESVSGDGEILVDDGGGIRWTAAGSGGRRRDPVDGGILEDGGILMDGGILILVGSWWTAAAGSWWTAAGS